MLIIRKDEVNNLIATVSMNKTLANPYYLFSFQHIASKERVSFIPQVITSNCRYDKFRFIEYTTTNLNLVPPRVNFPYLGQYYYSIYEQLTSGNTDPSLAFNKLESGRAVIIVGNDTINECLFEPYISNDENFSNVIYLSEDEQACITPALSPSMTPTPSITPTITSTPTVTPTITSTPTSTPIPCFEQGSGLDNQVSNLNTLNGKVYALGVFTNYNGTNVGRLIRIFNDGQLDTSFNLTGSFGAISDSQLQSDEKIYVGGNFTNYLGNNRIVRLNTDGSLDSSFFVGTTISAQVQRIAVQNDNKPIIIGQFTTISGISRNGIARLNTNGTLDTTFIVGTGFNAGFFMQDVKLQSDGKIICVGTFASYSGVTANRIIRLNNNGSVDNTFNSGTGFNLTPNRISIQSDGKYIVVGQFTSYSGVTANRIIRLNNDGSIDNTFNIGTGFNNQGNLIKIQSDGKILIGGLFGSYNGLSAQRIVRLNSDGSKDSTFQEGEGFDNNLFAMDILSNGKIIIGGFFMVYDNFYSPYMITLNSDGSVADCPPPTPTPTVTPSLTQTNTPTPSITPTLTPTTSCILVTQYLKAELQSCNNFQLSLWNTSGFTGPANALCDYVVSGTAYGDLGTVYNGTETIQNNDHTHSFNLNPVLLPGECVSGFTVNNVVFNGCVCPPNLILP